MGRQVSKLLEERVLEILSRENGFRLSYRSMAAEIGCTRQAVSCAIKQLVARGALSEDILRTRRPRNSYGRLHHQIVQFVEEFSKNTQGIKPTVRQIAEWFDVDVKLVYYHIRRAGIEDKVALRARRE